MYWIALLALLLAAAYDQRSREIPNWISLVLLIVALGAKLAGWHPVSWTGILVGLGAAFAVSFALFALGGLGGGDVKLLTALGAALGGSAFVPFAVATTLVGVFFAWRAKRRGDREIAYAPAMLAGLCSLLPLVLLAR